MEFDSPDLHPTADPSRQLRSAQSGHLHQKTTHDSFLASTDTAILLRFQNPFDELINRFPLWCGKADASTPLHKLPYLVYRQSFYVLHGDIHSPAALHPFPRSRSGSFRIGNDLPVQARPALETNHRFRLIPHWIILLMLCCNLLSYNRQRSIPKCHLAVSCVWLRTFS